MRNTLLTLCALFASLSLWAGIRTPEAARQLAAETLTQYSSVRRAPVRAEALTLAYTVQKHELDEAAYYVFNHTGDGFAVIAADDRVDGVILYSETGSLNEATMNPSLRWWLSRFQNELSAMTDEDAYHAPQRTMEAIEPLLGNITWDQGMPYNNLCPIDIADNTRCYTGCVATAAAQIMRYWNYPLKGIGTKTYTWYDYDPDSYSYWGGYTDVLQTLDLTADYENTYYDWANMLPSYGSVNYNIPEGQAVATLMYHCGVACEMQYGGEAMGGSGAMIDDMADGMVEHFGYIYEQYMDQYSQSSVTISALQNAFNGDLELGRPILMGGYDSYAGGHAFICDGRDASGKFHINWGWEGEGNCYTTLSSMKPTGRDYRFNQYLDAAIGMHPASHPTTPSDGHYATCREANLSSAGDTLFMEPVTVVYQDGQLTYLQDATGGALLYGATYSLNPGDVVEGVVGLSAPEKSQPQIRNLSFESDLTVSEGTVPTPRLLKDLPSDSVINQYVRIEDLLIDGRFTSASRTKKTAYTLDSLEVVLYNQFRIAYHFRTNAHYAVEGFVGRNNDEIRIYPIAYEETIVTALDETATNHTPIVRKVFVNGQVYILRDGVRYSVLGQKIE